MPKFSHSHSMSLALIFFLLNPTASLCQQPLPKTYYPKYRHFVKIYAVRDIPKGTIIKRSDFYTIPVRKDRIPGGTACIVSETVGRKVVITIRKGEPLFLNHIEGFEK